MSASEKTSSYKMSSKGDNSSTPLLKGADTNVELEFNENTGSPWYLQGLIIANIILGVGLLNFPSAYRDAGGVTSAVTIQIICVALVLFGMIAIAHCSDVHKQSSYQEVVRTFCGDKVLIICNIFIFVLNFGACTTFLVLLADQVDQVFLFSYGPSFCHYWYMDRYFTLPIIALVCVLPFCFTTRMDGFKFVSILGLLATLYIIFLVIYKYSTIPVEDISVRWSPRSWTDLFRVIPTVCFSFEGHIEAVPMYACLKKRKLTEFIKVVLLAFCLAFIVYTFVGTFGYLSAGDEVGTDLLLSYYPPDVVVLVGTGITAFKAATTYPCVLFCARMVVDDFVKSITLKYNISDRKRLYTITVCMFIVSLLLALTVPSIGSLISLLGGAAALFIFVFPGICLMQVYAPSSETKDRLKTIVACFMVVVGTFIAGTTTVQSIYGYINGDFIEVAVCIR